MGIVDVLQHLAAGVDVGGLPNPTGLEQGSYLQRILNTVFLITGAIAVLTITIAGIRFTASRGNPQETGKAKNAIVFAVIGLVIVILAWTIVNFVVVRVT